MEITIKTKMTEEEAIIVAKQLQRAGTLLRFYLGRLWNSVDKSTKAVLCERFEYKASTMRSYGAIVQKFPANFEKDYINNSSVTFTHFDYAARSEDPVATLNDAVERGLNSRELGDIVAQNTKDMAELIKEEEELKKTELPYTEPSSEFEYKANANVTKKLSDAEERVRPEDVFRVFGIVPGKVTKETYGLLYRNYSRDYHPDSGGGEEEFLYFSRVAEYFGKYVTDK